MQRANSPVLPSIAGSILALIAVAVLSPAPVLAYETYSEDGAGNCVTCHGDFRQSPYTSLSDGQSWGDDLHDVHRRTMLNSDCSTCHPSGGFTPVSLGSSAGGNGLAPISCVGCHGRAEDGTGSGSTGYGAGLRQHHFRAGIEACVDCHSDADPANKTVVGEHVLPPYYANPGNDHPLIPNDSCNPAPGFPEDFAATTQGLDNDGDDAYDENDPDCAAAAVCGNGLVEDGEECDDGNTVGGDCCSAECAFEAAGSICDDGQFCTLEDVCDGAGICSGAVPNPCDDGVGCTEDLCNEAADVCINNPMDAACDNGLFCDGTETCDAVLDCQPGTPVDCDDADICTDDACNEDSNACDNVFDPTNDPSCVIAECGNGVVEEGEQCDDGNTVGGDCCSAECAFEAAGAACDDGQFCTLEDVCDGAGVCGGSVPNTCDDGVGCTTDSCDEAGDICVNTPDDAACDNGLFCDGTETCDAVLDCQPGTPVDCDDADICTDDACNEDSNACDNVFDPTNDPSCVIAECGNGVLEEGEQCDDGNVLDGDCCSNTCMFEAAGSTCDDGQFCTLEDVCDGAGLCSGDVPNTCDDGVGCTVDSCDEAQDTCVNTPDDAACDNGLFCDGTETCDAVLDCRPGTPVNCDDADICTDDACNEDSNACDNVFDPTNDPSCALPVCGNGVLEEGEQCDDGNTADGDCCSANCTFEAAGSPCDDGFFCNLEETCDGEGTCGGGVPNACDDGIGCTEDSCNEADDRCVNTPDDARCDDGLFCNGEESCSAQDDCQAGTPVDCDDADICTDDDCNEETNTCDNVFDPTNDPTCAGACPDLDADGFADCTGSTCDPTGLECGDCNDNDPLINPAAPEDCTNGLDDDCDGAIDAQDPDCEGCLDADGDGYSPEGGDCGPVDCNDDDPAINPGAREICDDGIDNDCDGFIDGADSDCAVSHALNVHHVLAPPFVRLRGDEPVTGQVKVFVRNLGDAMAKTRVLLTSDPADGVRIVPLGAEMRNIKPGTQEKFTFLVTFTRPVLGDRDRMLVHFTAVAVDDEGRRSSPGSPQRDTLVLAWEDPQGRSHDNTGQDHKGRRPVKK